MEQATDQKKVFVITLLVFVIIFLIIFSFLGGERGISPSRTAPLILRTEGELLTLYGDTNKNNLPDWKDLLLEMTSSSTKELAAELPQQETLLTALNDPNNLTASFSKNIYTASAFIAKRGGLSEEEKSNVVEELLIKEVSKITVKKYTVSDIFVAKDDTLSTKKDYGNALGSILKQANTLGLGSNDVAIMKEFVAKKDDSLLIPLFEKKANLDKITDALLQVEVPPSAVVYHLMLINNIAIFSMTIENMAMSSKDPVRGLSSFLSYENSVSPLYISLRALVRYFTVEGITFTEKESGYILIPKNEIQ